MPEAVSAAVASALESSNSSPLDGDQLGKIRDILFGAQSRDQTRRVNSRPVLGGH